MLKEAIATRYITPLREGTSLPGLVEGDDLGTYVMECLRQGLLRTSWVPSRRHVTLAVVVVGVAA